MPARGRRGEQQLDRAQLLLDIECLEKLAARLAAPRQTITYEREAAQPAQRQTPEKLFAKLPVKETVEIVPDEVKAAPAAYEKIGEEKTFEVDITPPQLFKREIVRPKYRKIEIGRAHV